MIPGLTGFLQLPNGQPVRSPVEATLKLLCSLWTLGLPRRRAEETSPKRVSGT